MIYKLGGTSGKEFYIRSTSIPIGHGTFDRGERLSDSVNVVSLGYLLNKKKKAWNHHPCLWRVDSHEYKNNELKEAPWREVIKDCALPNIKEAKTLWKKLRDGYRQATGKKKTTSGQASNNTPKWKYEDQMSFLLPNMRNRPVCTNIYTNTMNIDSEASNSEPLIGTTSGEQQIVSDIGNENSQPRKRKNKSIVNILEQDVKRREKRAFERDALRKQILESNYKNVSSSNKGTEKFFMSMCDTTSELPEHLQIRVQRQLFNIVMEAREQHLMQTPSYPSPGHATNYNMSPASSLNLPIRAVSPNLLRSNSASFDYLNLPVFNSSQSPPTASSTPMMPPNTNDTQLIRQFSLQNTDMSTDAHSSGYHVHSVQNPSREFSSLMTPQNTTGISTDEDIRSYL